MEHELCGNYRATLRSRATSAAVRPTAPIVISTLRSSGCSALSAGSDGAVLPACAGASADSCQIPRDTISHAAIYPTRHGLRLRLSRLATANGRAARRIDSRQTADGRRAQTQAYGPDFQSDDVAGQTALQ